MKKFIIILGFVLLDSISCFGQIHLSHFFDLENEFQLEGVDVYNKRWVGCLCGNTLSFCPNQVSRDKKDGYVLKLHRVNVNSGKQEIVSILLPDKKKAAIWDQKYWIYDVFEDSLGLLITTQNKIFEYEKTILGEFIYRTAIETEEADYSFRSNHELFGISQINDYGFLVKKLHEQRNRLDSLTSFRIPAGFLLQYGPNGYLRHCDNFFFFLPSPEPCLELYGLSGMRIAKVDLNFANWQTMPDDYVSEIKSLPYGTDRALHVFNTSATYSFPLEVIPYTSDKFLLVSHQYDVERETPFLAQHLITIRNNDIQNCIPVCTTLPADETIDEGEFPMYYNNPALCLSVGNGGRCVQLVREADVDYRGLTGKSFKEKSEAYLQENEPRLKVRVMKLKTQNPEK